MNCTKGDLAVIVRVSADALKDAIGRTFTVAEPVVMSSAGHPGWRITPRQIITMSKHYIDTNGLQFKPGEKAFFDEVPDWWLQPIRGQRDASRDATLIPRKQVENAR